MPNKRNVDALTGILLLVFEGATWHNGEEFSADDAAHYAAQLASRGVLVPSALTPEHCDEVFDAAMHIYHLDGPEPEIESPRVSAPPGYAWDWESGPLIRELERIAKGEA